MSERDYFTQFYVEDDAGDRVQEALKFIAKFGDCDGAHHKQWALDQVARILAGDDEAYREWLRNLNDGEDGPDTYGWDEGIAP